jgi:hypothetical protein
MNKTIQLMILVVVFCTSQIGFSQVGINTTNPLSTLDINGNLSVKTFILNGSSSVTQISDGVYISLNPLSTNQVFNIPSAVTYPGRVYILRNINNTNTADITSSGGLFFYKGTTNEADPTNHKIYLYDASFGGNRTVILLSDGINWTVFN